MFVIIIDVTVYGSKENVQKQEHSHSGSSEVDYGTQFGTQSRVQSRISSEAHPGNRPGNQYREQEAASRCVLPDIVHCCLSPAPPYFSSSSVSTSSPLSSSSSSPSQHYHGSQCQGPDNGQGQQTDDDDETSPPVAEDSQGAGAVRSDVTDTVDQRSVIRIAAEQLRLCAEMLDSSHRSQR